MATCGEGDTVLVQRNCHKSILTWINVSKGKSRIFNSLYFIEEWGVPGGSEY